MGAFSTGLGFLVKMGYFAGANITSMHKRRYALDVLFDKRSNAFAGTMALVFTWMALMPVRLRSQPAKQLPVTPIDFSYAGFKGGDALPPKVKTVLFVRPTGL